MVSARKRGAELRRKTVKLARLARTPAYVRSLRLGVAAAIEHNEVAFGRDFHTVIDIGANRGQFALFALHRFPHAAVHCFEPVPQAMHVLRRTVGDNDRVVLWDVAVGAREDRVQINVSERDDCSSLLVPGSKLKDLEPASRTVSTVSAVVKRLDGVFQADTFRGPTLLKIDVQGFEEQVLQGAEGLLPVLDEILVEGSFVEMYEGQCLADELISMLSARGFRLRGVFSMTRDSDGTPLQADLLFARRS
jgi:FkbM family methyltransferase